MRKVLLATTALVAMGGVSAASADVSLSGSGHYTYKSWSDNDTSGDDTTGATVISITVSGSTTSDSGMTFGGSQTLTDGSTNGSSLYVSDDWGKITFGGASAARSGSNSASVSSFTGNHGDQAFGTTLNTNSRIGAGNDASRVAYTSPNISGLVVNASVSNAGGKAGEQNDESAYAVSYNTEFEGASVGVDFSSLSLGNTAGTGTTTDATGMGATVTVDDITLMIGSSTDKNSTGTTKVVTTDYGIDYAVNDSLSVEAWAVSSKEDGTTNTGDKLSMTQVGLKYTVTTGLYVSATSRSFDYKDASAAAQNNKGDGVTVRVGVTF